MPGHRHERAGAHREVLRQWRRAVGPAAADRAALRLRDQLTPIPSLRGAHRVAAYLAHDGEIDLGPTIAALARRGVEVSVPVMVGDDMSFAVLLPAAPRRIGRFGIVEPADHVRRELGDLDVVLAPAVAVDRTGHRLGRGGGHYDRMLADRRPGELLVIGVVHAFQVVDRLDPAPWDVRVDMVVTDQAVIDCRAPGSR